MQLSAPEAVQAQVQTWLKEYGHPEVAIAHLLCDRHAQAPDTVALVYEDAAEREARYTFPELRDLSAKWAGVLYGLGVTKRDRVATLLPKTPELLITTLALWRLGAVYVPLFTAFGPQAIAYRVANSAARVVVTDPTNRAKIDQARGLLGTQSASLARIVTVEGPDGDRCVPPGDIPFWAALEAAVPVGTPVASTGEDVLILIYTSGTTGEPKGVEVPVKALASIEAYMRFGLELRDDDVFWNMADPGWAYGLYYGLVGVLLLGKASLFFNAPFDVQATYRILQKYGVTNLTAAPTAFRLMRAAGGPTAGTHQLRLRVASSVGEPLNPDVITWAAEHLGVPIYDHYGQTELSMVVMNHHLPALQRPLRPGSMGHALPGFRVVILDEAGTELGPGHEGQLTVDTQQSPLYWFQGYYQAPERTAERFTGGGRYYLTGDTASQDTDRYVFFTGRNDDIITSAGYRIGPFEPESVLMGHAVVAEVAVVGKPDPLRGEVVKAYVVVKPGYTPSAALAEELRQFVRANLSAHAYPREVEFVDQLPKTPSGKIQRFLLRSW